MHAHNQRMEEEEVAKKQQQQQQAQCIYSDRRSAMEFMIRLMVCLE